MDSRPRPVPKNVKGHRLDAVSFQKATVKGAGQGKGAEHALGGHVLLLLGGRFRKGHGAVPCQTLFLFTPGCQTRLTGREFNCFVHFCSLKTG